ncbi:hypothetical protein [Actinoplanes regularis]|uniref:Uncharacterized protein n=1 Tax=Actinoplanes regularis TaxID=52697 RepID=A0A239BIH6_9ACTN|nr:hypothetical protein [Actinoplanes regularis]GIE87985.1 hypothetical protein Are01nite_44650 [Actinoplanes regularis]SNS06843.1 hypothetical protein SAMN06264365_109190 [Actinoplanes regularis]
MSGSRASLQIGGTITVAVLAALSWFGWMGWDNEYTTDPVTGATSGPYAAWQVIGCALTLLTVFAGAVTVGVRPVFVSLAITLAFTAAWTLTASGDDSTGLYLVGTVLVFGGLAVATLLASVVATAIQHRRGHAGVGGHQ